MEPERKFRIYAASLFFFVGITSILEIFNANMFRELFMGISNHTAWILGITVGMVVPDIIAKIKSRTVDRILLKQKVDERFFIFLSNAALLAFVVSLARGIVLVFLQTYFEYFHIILTQWMVLVYLWFKFINGFKISWKYVIATEGILILFTTLLLFFLK